MLRNYNTVIFGIFLGIVCIVIQLFSTLDNPPLAYAQTCGGSSTCFSATLKDTQWQETYTNPDTGTDIRVTCSTCDYSGGDKTAACQHYAGGSPYCSACVENDEGCGLGPYYYGNPDPDCYQYVWIYGYPLQGNYCPGGDDQKPCWGSCTTYCNSSPHYGACTGLSEPYNHCGTAFGSQTCTYEGPQSCTFKNCGPVGCSDGYDNCDGGIGYACGAGSVCRKTMGGKVTNAETGAGIPNITITTSAGNDTTDANGNWSVGGFGYQTAFTITPASSGTPCTAGYVCGGVNPTSPNPGNKTGTVGGAGDCGGACDFTYTPGHIAGHVYIDYNHDGTKDAEDVGIAGVTIGSTGPNLSDTTDGNGAYDIGNLNDGAHTVTITVPAGYRIVGSTTQNITIGPNDYGADFYITPLYNIAGIVYNDFDAGDCYNPSLSDPKNVNPVINGCTDKTTNPDTVHGAGIDTPYTIGSSTVTVVGTGVNQNLTQNDGTYDTTQVLESGTYTVTFTTLPTNYHMTYPVGGVPPSFTVTVGTPGKSSACSVGTYNDATCDGQGSISNLNFGMNDEITSTRFPCADVRDETTTQDFIPNNATCGILSGNYAITDYNNKCVTGSGIYTSGAVTPDFGFGQANQGSGPNQPWLVGGATPENFSPVNPGVIRTSMSYMRTTLTNNNLATTDLTTVCTTTDCYLPNNLPSGIYVWPYDTTFMGTHDTSNNTDVPGTYTFPSGKNYIFLIGDTSNKSDITFKTKILVPNGSTATFVSSNDMIVDPSVGESDITSTAGDMEGFYSADESFIIDSSYVSSNRCTDTGGTKDLRFNLIGSVVVNAAGNGGAMTNQRDLCAGDLSCPTTTTGTTDGTDNLGLTYILNAPQAVKHKNTFWQELAP